MTLNKVPSKPPGGKKRPPEVAKPSLFQIPEIRTPRRFFGTLCLQASGRLATNGEADTIHGDTVALRRTFQNSRGPNFENRGGPAPTQRVDIPNFFDDAREHLWSTFEKQSQLWASKLLSSLLT